MNAQFWAKLQEEVAIWHERSFPRGRPHEPHHPLLGIVEECGELTEAVEAGDAGATMDALADVAIFSADLCERVEWDLAEIARLGHVMAGAPFVPALMVCLGQLARYRLKVEQGIRGAQAEHVAVGRGALAAVFAHLWRMADARGLSLEQVVEDVWRDVRERDWRKWPETGRPPAEDRTA